MPTRTQLTFPFVMSIAACFLIFFWNAVTRGSLVLAGLSAILIVLFFSYYLEFGLYILIILYPLIGWELHLDTLKGVLGSSSTALDFYAPMVDVWAVFMIGTYGIYLVRKWLMGEKHRIYLPQLRWYALFILSAALSLVNVSGWELHASISYLIRFVLFVYVGYVVLGTNIIRSKEIFRRALTVALGISVVGAFLGLASFVVGGSGMAGVYRAVPIKILGWAPFNYDLVSGHILLAEILVVAFPIGLYLMLTAKKESQKLWYGIAAGICGVTALLTFSRASWVTLIFALALAAYLFRSVINWKKIKKYIYMGIICSIPAVLYMVTFLQSGVVSSSNSTRIILTEVAWKFFLEHPILGQGIGTFVSRLTDVYLFTYEFGDPIDAHSIVTKIMAEQGLLGIITFGLFIGSVLYAMYTRSHNQSYDRDARAASYLSIFLVTIPVVFQLFNTQYYSARMWVPIMLAIAGHLVYRHEHEKSGYYTHFRPDKYKIDTEVN